MKLYNTLSRKVEEIKPQNPPDVTVYSCGPTVYDYPHIGNWFTFIRYDVLVRALKDADYQPIWTMNITDVGHLVSDGDEGEDKLEKGAKREGKSAWDIANFYTDYFLKSLGKLNITKPDILPRATEHIDEQIELIKKLEKKGFTYKISDGIYFDTSKLDDYGKLAKLDTEHLKEGARVEANPEKRNPTDFALWKLSPKDQKRDMEWNSPWGLGFPGWHLECSAMAMQYLGETIDIHAGGIDHIPVHHTNEIAQSESVTGKQFAKLWLHVNFLLVAGKKIAKSSGSFIVLEDIQKKGFDLASFRLLALQSHYRTEANFSWQNLEAAQNRLKSFQAWADLRFQNFESKKLATNYAETKKKLADALSDDLNTPKTLALINSAIDVTEEHGIDSIAIAELAKVIDSVLGLNLSQSTDISLKQKEILQQRADARSVKDFSKSDELRKLLETQGIGVRDTENGQIWYRL